MSLRVVPPAPPPGGPDDGDVRQFTSRGRVYLIAAVLLTVMLVFFYQLFTLEPPPAPPPPVHKGPPSLKLQPSAVVPGPMQIPRPIQDRGSARADEVLIFRAMVNGTGYVVLALELRNGQLIPFHGLEPLTRPVTDSVLLSQDQVTIAYPLAKHKDQEVTIVGLLSLTPFERLPERVPTEPRTWPDPARPVPPDAVPTAAPPAIPGSTVVAWDRISVRADMVIPPPPKTPM